MTSNLEELKKKKAMLLKKAGMQSANLESLKQRRAEEQKLKAEIFALEHPESAKARSLVKSAFVGFLKKAKSTTITVLNNAERLERERKERNRKEALLDKELQIARLRSKSKRKVKKITTKKKVTRKRRRR